MIQHGWEASLDALEARLARQEAALAQGVLDGGFEAVALPSASLSERDRVRAQLALERVRRLEAELRQRQHAMAAPGRQSPYS
ncbi:MAG: hypothetical protein IT196_17720 [Acidimicrobiales bacterium]|nr:hypothetical protein [Acidimicrobiales bacterium]